MKVTTCLLAGILACASSQTPATAQSAIDLGAASDFAVLGGASVVNTGSSVITGDLGVYSGTSVTGFPPGIVSGTIDSADAAAENAQSAATAAYAAAAEQTVTDPGVTVFADTTLTPGVYDLGTSIVSGTLTLDGEDESDPVFIFQTGSTLSTAIGSQILLTDGAQADDVFWQVGSSATLGGSSAFEGTILAQDSITLDAGATVDGGLLALSGTATLDDNDITAVPEPADATLLLAGCAGLLAGVRGIRQRCPAASPS